MFINCPILLVLGDFLVYEVSFLHSSFFPTKALVWVFCSDS
uniref:Uncharacterized protein n=1 Tax=Rhizophora mucronata TaxID=61149 RepID=A0A2P2PLK1_RHIMU